MRRGYDKDIRAEAVTRRWQGKRWEEIRETIGQKFGVRPCIRQMQKWFAEYRGATDEPVGERAIAAMVKDAAERARPLAYLEMMTNVMPLWRQLQRYGLSVEDAAWVALERFWEAQIGRERYDRIHSVYLEVRDRLAEQPGSKLTWSPPPIERHSLKDLEAEKDRQR
jgi:hypothetical protein